SEAQTKEVAAAAAADPAAEADLLRAARTARLAGLKERCRNVKAAAAGAAEEIAVYERIRQSRYLRHWTDPDGAVRLDGRLGSDATVHAVLTDGVDVTAVAHLGRTIPAHLRTALAERDPVCCVPGCDVRRGLEIDHRIPYAEGGPTSLANLARMCGWHHY